VNGKRPGGWVALAWRYFRDPKFSRVSDGAELLYLRALAYSGEHESDGAVDRVMLFALRPRVRIHPSRLAAELVAAGLWIETVDGYSVPPDTWSRWQDTAEQRRAARARTAERQARFRERNATRNPSRNGGPGAGAGAGAVRSTKTPVPLHAVQEPDASQDPPPATWLDDRGYLFVGRPDDNGAEP
jgi:hypothetical protein